MGRFIAEVTLEDTIHVLQNALPICVRQEVGNIAELGKKAGRAANLCPWGQLGARICTASIHGCALVGHGQGRQAEGQGAG